jgi:chemotaxis protein methyltransferase CheR
VTWLLGRASIDAKIYRDDSLARRIPACLRSLGARSLAHAQELIERNPSLVSMAISSLLIGMTSFFRDPAVFNFLTEHIFPRIVQSTCDGPRIWCVGCSDGAELYSVAMLLDDAGMLDRADLLGTDCRSDAVARAAAGSFHASMVETVSPGRLAKHFRPDGPSRWAVDRRIQSKIRWAVADALATDDGDQWDMILCRNCAMYLDPPAAARLWARLEAAVRPGGILVLGKAERPQGAAQLLPLAPCVYQRRMG